MLVEGRTGTQRLRADHVYLMTGFTPNTTLLQQLGVTMQPDTGVPALDPATMETDVERVFIAGVLARATTRTRSSLKMAGGTGR